MWGKVTDGSLDRDGQIVDPDWAAEKLMDWFHDLGAPVRNMHSGTYPPAGKGIDLSIEDDGAYVRAAIVEPTAIKLLDLGVYKDFSVGIAEAPLYSDPGAPGGRLGKAGDPDGWINEISLVDTGSNKNSHLTIVKRAKRDQPPEILMEIIGEEGTLTKSLRARAGDYESKETKTKMADTTKAMKIPDGRIPCDGDSCEGGVIKGELPCPKCKGKGHLPDPAAKAAKKAAKAEVKAAKKAAKAAKAAATKDADDDVRDAIGDAADSAGNTVSAIGDAASAQANDDDDDKAAGSVAITPPAQNGIMSGDTPAKPDAGGPSILKGKAAKTKGQKKVKVKVKPDAGDGDGKPDGGDGGDGGDDSKLPAFLRKKGKGKKRAPDIPYLAVRAHDLLCPCYAHKVKKSAYGDVTPEALDPDFIREAVARLATKKAAPGSVAEAARALEAAVGLQNLAPKTFADLARAAHKGWLQANPGLPALRPGLISPEQFRRGFLAGADDTVGNTTRVPSPDLKPTLTAERFDRGPLTDNQARPTLVGGSSVAKEAPIVKGRTFYTNQARSEHTSQMGDLHDFIANNYAGVCPMSNPEGRINDSDGQIGRPAEMNAPLPPEGGNIDTKGGATVTAVRDTSRANKASGTDELDPEAAIRAEVKRRVTKATKRQTREVRRLKKAVKSMSSLPDPRASVVRSHPFARPKSKASDPVRLAKAREAVSQIQTRDSRNADEAIEELRDLGLTPRQFAELVTAVPQ